MLAARSAAVVMWQEALTVEGIFNVVADCVAHGDAFQVYRLGTVSKKFLEMTRAWFNSRDSVVQVVIRSAEMWSHVCQVKGKVHASVRGVSSHALVSWPPCLISLDLEGMGICDAGAEALAGPLRINATVTMVNLGDNKITAEGIKHLTDALKDNKTVSEFIIWGNFIGDEGAKHVADLLSVTATVTSINLGGNEIKDEGIKHLADALTHNNSVSELALYTNGFGDVGAEALAGALRVNGTVTALDLRQSWKNLKNESKSLVRKTWRHQSGLK